MELQCYEFNSKEIFEWNLRNPATNIKSNLHSHKPEFYIIIERALIQIMYYLFIKQIDKAIQFIHTYCK